MELAKAADLCLSPYRHGVRFAGEAPDRSAKESDCDLLIEVRDPAGVRRPERDLELEIYRSGSELNLMLSWVGDDDAPVLWHGSHPVWMQAASGERCATPDGGAPLEALCRRIRTLLISLPDTDA